MLELTQDMHLFICHTFFRLSIIDEIIISKTIAVFPKNYFSSAKTWNSYFQSIAVTIPKFQMIRVLFSYFFENRSLYFKSKT